MALRAALRELSEVVGRMEGEGYEVSDVKPIEGSILTEDALAVDLSVHRPLDETIASATCAEIDVNGSPNQSSIPATLSVRIELEAAEASSGSVRGAAAPGVLAHDDPVALRRAYENHETFKDMTEALDVDVSPSTVRRHMIKHGIHEPEPMVPGDDDSSQPIPTVSDVDAAIEPAQDVTVEGRSIDSEDVSEPIQDDVETTAVAPETGESAEQTDGTAEPGDVSSGDGAAEEGTVEDTPATERPELDLDAKRAVTDGIGLPEHLTLEDVIDIVDSSTTLFEARRKMDVDQNRARRILDTLDVLDLLTGRLSNQSERDVPRSEITARIHQATRLDAMG